MIAEAVGVSTSPVSFVMTGCAQEMKTSPKTVKRVLEAADRPGFVANYHACSLSLGRSHTLGLVSAWTGENTLSRFQEAIATEVAEHYPHLV